MNSVERMTRYLRLLAQPATALDIARGCKLGSANVRRLLRYHTELFESAELGEGES